MFNILKCRWRIKTALEREVSRIIKKKNEKKTYTSRKSNRKIWKIRNSKSETISIDTKIKQYMT